MTPVDQLPQLVEALISISGVLERLGIPGVISLLIVVTVTPVAALLTLNYVNSKNLAAMHEQSRRDTQAIVQQLRSDMSNALEIYRSDTLNIVRELGQNQLATAQFYKDNVELVKDYKELTKDYKRVANDLSDLIVGHTTVLQRLAGLIETNMQCPVVRETAHGKK
ncbi:MAG: hypothetical protein Q3X91_07240 [Bilophila sp.]|nr:hypothetical protein [Bilophila sp.]